MPNWKKSPLMLAALSSELGSQLAPAGESSDLIIEPACIPFPAKMSLDKQMHTIDLKPLPGSVNQLGKEVSLCSIQSILNDFFTFVSSLLSALSSSLALFICVLHIACSYNSPGYLGPSLPLAGYLFACGEFASND
jgi:hypothetical protein